MKIHIFSDIDSANKAIEDFEKQGLWIINVRVTPLLLPDSSIVKHHVSVITGWKKPERDTFRKSYNTPREE